MKRWIAGLILILAVVGCATAQTTPTSLILYRETAIFQWEPVTTTMDGEPLLPTDTVEYEAFLYDWQLGVTNDQDVSQLTAIGTVATNEIQIVFPYRAYWAAGVRAKVTQGDGQIVYSERIAWSNYIEDVAPDPDTGERLGFLYAPLLGGVSPATGLRDSGM